MADRRVRYILEVDYAGGSAALTAADQLREVDDAAREAGEGLTQAEGGFSKLQANIVTAGAALGVAQQGFEVIANGARAVWGALEEGAALQDAREDFDALAVSVGSAADVMLNRMGEAAGGMLTNAEMIGAASDLMLLNLGLTEGQIVDLVGVAGELEWSMDALANTLNTKSTRGLKELGLGIEDVQGRVEELTAQGHSLDEAFTLAILEAGRERIELVGGASETAAGKMVIATNAVSDFTAALKENLVVALEAGGFFDWLGEQAQQLSAATDLRELTAQYKELTGLDWDTSGTVTPWGIMGADPEGDAQRVRVALGYLALAEASSADATRDFTETQDEATAAAADSADAVMLGAGARQEYIEQQEWIARAAAWAADEQRSAASADYVRARAVAELNQEMANQEAAVDLAGRAAQAWAEYTAEATARGGDYFEQITQTGRAQWDLNDAIYAGAAAHGAGAADLGQIGVETGQFRQSVADAGVAAAQQQAIIDSIAGSVRDGALEWDDYAGAVERAIEILNGVPEAKPEIKTDIEDFKGYLPDFALEEGGEMTYYAKVEIGADYLAVEKAVDEARGIVEGFASPEEVYQAVVGLDITAVEKNGETVRTIIEGLPDRKKITIDVEVIGQALLDQLQALGALPQ